MNMRRNLIIIIIGFLCAALTMQAQEFFNLTAQQVRIDSVLPRFTHQMDVGTDYAADYEVTIDYPEFIDMSATDIARLSRITHEPLPELPVIDRYVVMERKHGKLVVSFVPLVFREGKYQKLVSFKLKLKPTLNPSRGSGSRVRSRAGVESTYSSHSVLSSGRWVKISVPETGIYELTADLCRRAGFSNPAKVKVYGYGGALQPEALTQSYLSQTDDLKEVATCLVGGHRLFRAIGTVSWETNSTLTRTRNYFSKVGCYFLTEGTDDPLTVDSATFVGSFYPATDDYHSLAEDEGYAWYHGGRNLYGSTALSTTKPTSYALESGSTTGQLMVSISYNGVCAVRVSVNDSVVGTIEETEKQAQNDFASNAYAEAATKNATFTLTNLRRGSNTVKLEETIGTSMVRPDQIALAFNEPKAAPQLSAASWPVPDYMYAITNQNHHADSTADMIIIIPTSQQLREQAERLKAYHETDDSLSVRIVPADELFNEFSSGTPDGNAYRRYLKMLYDRAENDEQMPRYLLLMGDGAWDNRMLCSQWHSFSPDDFLLTFQSENSFSHVYSFTSDDFFAMLDDEETVTSYRGRADMAVGRLSARTNEEAKIVVDKIIGYGRREHAGAWQNTICLMGDDGNGNNHMADAESLVGIIENCDDGYHLNKIYWDAYTRETSATGNSYPEVEKLIKQQLNEGALFMNYSGHGAAYCLSHEQTLKLADMKNASSGGRLPLWLTASCDIAPFDSNEDNLGETALFNSNGGAIAFVGTTRTVYMDRNRLINQTFTSKVLEKDAAGTLRYTIGEALQQAKNTLVESSKDLSQNKLHYMLLGDPALRLAAPTARVVIDSMAGQAFSAGTVKLSAGKQVTVKGHIEGCPQYRGIATSMVFDVEETVVCHLNEEDSQYPNTTNFEFKTRQNCIYRGSDSIVDGRFSFTFAVPRDISYSDLTGQVLIFARSDGKDAEAHGQQTGFVMGSSGSLDNDGIGPNIYCYLNSEEFRNGGTVNATPYFHAVLTDRDGINAAGSGIGHDIELCVDNDPTMTYNLNSAFQYDFGSYQSGSVGYTLPKLAAGEHHLSLRAWDVLNNSSVAELTFVVDPKQKPRMLNIVCTKNPATTYTQFIISHDRTGSNIDVTLQIFDPSGRLLWQRAESGVSAGNTYTVNWDLTTSSGSRLRTGVYLYRLLLSSEGSSEATAARKLIVLGNN